MTQVWPGLAEYNRRDEETLDELRAALLPWQRQIVDAVVAGHRPMVVMPRMNGRRQVIEWIAEWQDRIVDPPLCVTDRTWWEREDDDARRRFRLDWRAEWFRGAGAERWHLTDVTL